MTDAIHFNYVISQSTRPKSDAGTAHNYDPRSDEGIAITRAILTDLDSIVPGGITLTPQYRFVAHGWAFAQNNENTETNRSQLQRLAILARDIANRLPAGRPNSADDDRVRRGYEDSLREAANELDREVERMRGLVDPENPEENLRKYIKTGVVPSTAPEKGIEPDAAEARKGKKGR